MHKTELILNQRQIPATDQINMKDYVMLSINRWSLEVVYWWKLFKTHIIHVSDKITLWHFKYTTMQDFICWNKSCKSVRPLESLSRRIKFSYSLVVDPKGHPGHNDNHETRNVNGKDKKGQLPGKDQHHAETTVSTCKIQTPGI